MANVAVTSFNNGEVTPHIDARSDVEKYASSCRILENMLPLIYGDAVRRPGTKYIATAKNSPQGVRLIPFIYSSEIAYMCEFGNLYIRFYHDGAPLLDDAGDPVEVASPYLVGDLPKLQFRQIADTMWLVHPKYAPRKLTRTTITSFSLDAITFENGPFLVRNDIEEADDVTMASSVTVVGTSGTLTASVATFENEHVGALWLLEPTNIGIVRIDGVVSPTVANVTVLATIDNTSATKKWAEGAWSGVRGYPGAITFFESRIIYGGTDYEPQSIWFSGTDDYEDFEAGVDAADSFSVMLAATNRILWLEALEALAVGTSGDEWRISSTKLDAPLIPTNFGAKIQSTYGSAPMQAVRVNTAVLFVDYVRRKVREFTFSADQQKYVAPDLAVLAEHITESGIVSTAHQKSPDSIFWCVRADGKLLSMTYEREQNVVAWARHLVGLTEIESSETTDDIESLLPSYKMTYFSDNGIIWGVPIRDRTLLRLNGEAIDRGGGLVGIPCAGHPFSAGRVIRIAGTTNYNGVFTLLSGDDSPNELVITDTYVAETFDGTESVVEYIGSLGSGLGRMAQDSEGNLFYGRNAGITKISNYGSTQDSTFFVPDSGWPATMSTVIGVKLTASGEHLYVAVDVTLVTNHIYLYKFNVDDGSQVWAIDAGAWGDYDIAVDADDNVYILGMGTSGNTNKYAAADGASTELDWTGEGKETYVSGGCPYAIAVDSERLVVGGRQFCSTGFDESVLYNLAVTNLDGTGGKQIALGGTFTYLTNDYTYTIGTGRIVIHDGYIYVLNGDGKLYKLDSELNVVQSITSPTYAIGLYVDLWGNIVVVNQDWATGQNEVLWYYDADLNYLSKVGGFYTLMFKGWDASTGGAYIQGNAAFWPGILPGVPVTNTIAAEATGEVESVAVIPADTEDEVWISVLRTVNGSPARYIEQMQPRAFGTREDAFFVDCGIIYDGDPASTFTGLDHLEGETVAILGDGAVYPAQVVSGGSVTISEEVSKAVIGLPFRFNLKPMRLDQLYANAPTGASKGSYKKIAELVISFMDTLNAQYGISSDELFDIDWRTTEVYDAPPDLYTGDKVVVLDGGFDPEDPILISGADPLPCIVRAIIARLDVVGR